MADSFVEYWDKNARYVNEYYSEFYLARDAYKAGMERAIEICMKERNALALSESRNAAEGCAVLIRMDINDLSDNG